MIEATTLKHTAVGLKATASTVSAPSPSMPQVTGPIRAAWRMGADADSLEEVYQSNVAQHGLAFLLLAILIGVAALVAGEFFEAIPSDGVFDDELGDIEGNVGTGLIILGIVLIVIPVVAIIAYLWANLGGLAGVNGRRM